MIGTAFIQHVPKLSLQERCMLHELAGHDCRDLTVSRVADLLGRRCSENWNSDELYDKAAAEAEWLGRNGGGIIPFTSAEYPALLREIYDPPFALCYRGRKPPAAAPYVALVGTRKPNGRGARSAYELAKELAQGSVPVVSGLARGIDRQAHEGAIAGGGITVAVLGSGVAEVGPASSRPTAEKLLSSGGAIFSEYTVFTAPRRYHFPMRNRIISGMSRCCVILQAPRRSGALITAEYALEQGRDVFVHSACFQKGVGDGGYALYEDGARGITRADELLEGWNAQWGYSPQAVRKEQLV
ncbi:DNA-processing protein DprA [Marispirochaeta sp.]|uniref:DNA-processing protein DprA n=1 Tax=Marispirochaeta sp. TaxID=2038653 RepID=UPI0029C7A584|nr:DNA-processing protein DprA [Marispirochaeta sp.]